MFRKNAILVVAITLGILISTGCSAPKPTPREAQTLQCEQVTKVASLAKSCVLFNDQCALLRSSTGMAEVQPQQQPCLKMTASQPPPAQTVCGQLADIVAMSGNDCRLNSYQCRKLESIVDLAVHFREQRVCEQTVAAVRCGVENKHPSNPDTCDYDPDPPTGNEKGTRPRYSGNQ